MVSAQNKKFSGGKSPLMVIVAVLIVVAIAALAYWFWGKNLMSQLPLPSASVFPTAGTTGASPTGSAKPSASPTKTPAPTPTPKPLSLTVGSTAILDGFESSNGGGNLTLEIRAGRNSNLITRGFVSFKIPSELQGKTVDKATMRLYQGQVIGAPYTALGNLLVDHVNYGSTLDNSAYAMSALQTSFATVTNNQALEYKDTDVKDQLIDDLANGRTYSEYRLHFAIEAIGGDLNGDFAYFESQDNSMNTGKQPQLVISYH